jgi:hypothetical protein
MPQIQLATHLLETLCQIDTDFQEHPTEPIRVVIDIWEVTRTSAGWQVDQNTYWTYSTGEIVNWLINHIPPEETTPVTLFLTNPRALPN